MQNLQSNTLPFRDDIEVPQWIADKFPAILTSTATDMAIRNLIKNLNCQSRAWKETVVQCYEKYLGEVKNKPRNCTVSNRQILLNTIGSFFQNRSERSYAVSLMSSLISILGKQETDSKAAA